MKHLLITLTRLFYQSFMDCFGMLSTFLLPVCYSPFVKLISGNNGWNGASM